MWLALLPSVASAAPAAGSWIENRASLSYVDAASGLSARLESNRVQVQVLAVTALSLGTDQSQRHAPASTYALSHHLVNTGNATATIKLFIDAPSGAVLRLVRDDDGNGRADAGEPELRPGDNLVLAAGDGAHLLVLGVVPGDAAPDERIVLRLRAETDGARAANTDTIAITQGPVLKLWKESLTPVASPGGVVVFRITATNTGTDTATGLPVMVDGKERNLVLLTDRLPANTEAQAWSNAPVDSTLSLYHWRGEPAATFHTAPPTEMAAVDQLAWGLESLAPGHTVSFDLNLRVRRNAAGAVSNQAIARFGGADGADGPQQSSSNRVVVSLPSQPPVLEFFRDRGFTEPSRVASSGETVYVQADAAECNRDANSAELVSLTLRSALTGDVETFLAEESAPNSGLFRIARGMLTAESGTAVPGDGWLAVRPNDRITGSLAGCGSSMTEAELLIDPYGVVYDSKTNAPIAGARVTLIDVTGAGNGGQPGAPARVFAEDGTTPAPATVLSDDQGRYAFPKVPSSDYRFLVVPPAGYAFPSELPPALQPGGRSVNVAASYGTSFSVNADTGDVHADLPLDAALAQALRVRKRAAREQVEVGDFLDYRIEVANLSAATLGGVLLNDILPPGFIYVSGSTRRDGQPAADPTSTNGRLLYPLGSLASQASTTLVYRVRVSAHVREGAATNRAEASSAAPLAAGSNVASATVTVRGGVFSDRGYLLGRVFLVCPGEPVEQGLPGVRLWLETGDSAITDAQGRYHFDDLLPVTHVLKLDPLTLPAGVTPQSAGSRDAGDVGSRFVDLRNGELRRADFAMHTADGCAPPALPAEQPLRTATLPRAIPALPKLESLLTGLGSTPVFLSPTQGSVLPAQQTVVRVAGPVSGRLELWVNSERVPLTRIARRVEDTAHGMLALEYLGVNLRPGSNQLELLVFDDFGNQRARQAISVTAPGALARIDLAAVDALIADGRSPARIRVRLFDAAGVPVAARTAVTLEASAGRWLVEDPDAVTRGLQFFVEGGEALLSLLPPQTPGQLQLRAQAGVVRGETGIAVAPALRPLVAVGIVEGVLDLSRLGRGGLLSASSDDGFEHELRQLGSSDALRGRTALFLQGKVKGETLLTLSYDSEKPQRDGLFRDIQPERYYPVYGDSAVRGFAATSASPLYVRIDRGQSFLLYGDFNTAPRSTSTSNGPLLARYQRSLTGIAQHYESDGTKVDAWASQGSSRQVVQEFPGLGVSGPYTLGAGNIVRGSEKVELLVRDRNQPAVVLRSSLQTAFIDYELDTDTGRLLFRSPVPSLDPELNPVSVRISFESAQDGPGFWVMGGSADLQIAPSLSVGASLAIDQDPRSPYSLGGVRATWQPLPTTRISAEMASSRRSRTDKDEPGNGQALRIEVAHQDGPLSLQLSAGQTDAGFDNPVAPLNRGRDETKASAAYVLNANTRLSAEALRSADPATDARREGARLSVERQLGDGVRLEAGLRVAHETNAPAQPNSPGAVDFTSVRARLSAPVPWWPAASVYGEAEHAVAGSGGLLAMGGEVRWASWGRLYGRHEFINSFSGLYGLNGSQQHRSTVIGLDGNDGDGLRVFSEYRGHDAVEGRPAEAAVGLRRMWPVAEGLRISTGFERVSGLGGTSRDEATALSSGVEWSPRPALRVAGRLEWRDAPIRRQWLATSNAAWKLAEAWSLLGKGSLDLSQPQDGSTALQRERLQIGLAWREPGSRWLMLARHGWQRDDGPDSARKSQIASLHANLKASAQDEWTWRYAFKRSREDSQGVSSRGTAQLLSTRWLHDLGERWDVGLGARLLADSASAKPRFGMNAELGWRLAPNLWVTGGLNWLDLRDVALAGAEPLRRGAYLRLRFKFDESLLAGVLPP